MADRVKVAVVGSGNIGTDLLYKVLRSETLEPVAMIGIDPDSDGLARAASLGLWTTAKGLDAFLVDRVAADVAIVFDATSAATHLLHAPKLKAAGKIALDLTPAAVGPLTVPAVKSAVADGELPWNLNFVSCGGQATTPIVHALGQALNAPLEYAEVVSTTASKSVGLGTRANLDEYLNTTSRALCEIGGAHSAKTIALINPAEPPIVMRNTIYALVEEGHESAISAQVEAMVREVQTYVPGYRTLVPPQFEPTGEGKTKFTTITEVEGAGDYFPSYAGNLDIMTSAAVRVAEQCAVAVAAGAEMPVVQGGVR